jgi:diguanylate cyclase (GGDEF)-like protein
MTDKTKALLASLTVKDNVITGCNNVFTEFLGFTELQIKNCSLKEILVLSEDALFTDLDALFDAAIANDDGVIISAKIFNTLYYALSVKVHCIDEHNGVFKLYFSISNNKSIDPISGLPNGWALASRIDYLVKVKKVSLKDLALIVVDVDNFSTINYRYDFSIGDKYLVELGKLLQKTAENYGFVIRFSNAKFAILVEDLANLLTDKLNEHIHHICQELCVVLANPIRVSDNLQITKSFSIGVSAPGFEYDMHHPMELAAETVLKKAKTFSTNEYFIALPDTKNEFLTRKLIIDALPEAISRNFIQLYYQPQYDIYTNEIIGLEALSRWTDNTLGIIAPDVFVPITEDIGLHFEFDLWVFAKVCEQLVLWNASKIPAPRVAINISFKTMEMSNFVERIITILKNTGCATSLLELEVVETSSINNAKMIEKNMAELKQLGISIAIDDFGTGYSSLNLIRILHQSLDKIKLDRTLIDKICQTQLDKKFTQHIIEMGNILDVKVLAEGVETKEQLDLLIELGCDYAQGYYFTKPVSRSDVEVLIQANTISA